VEYQDKIKRIVEMLKESDRTLALTGAGVSTESGIPDYRSPGTGLWTKMNPTEVANVTALRRDPARFYNSNLERWTMYADSQPNIAHTALAQLEKDGLLLGIITQNIDGLHVKAGSKRVYEVHGHLRTCRCFDCEASYPFSELTDQHGKGINPPRCAKCNGVLRPDIVLFEDAMGQDYFLASRMIIGCKLLLVVGSSLQVYPVASLPEHAKKLIIINQQPTPYDRYAEIVINDVKAGQVFTDLMNALKPQ